jgi:hypothetical protein
MYEDIGRRTVPGPSDGRRWSTPLQCAAGTRAERFLAPTSVHVIRDVLITPDASVRLADVVLSIR